MPEILKPAEQLLGELMPESNYTGFGTKKDDKIYRSMLLSTKSTARGQGIAGKVSYQMTHANNLIPPIDDGCSYGNGKAKGLYVF